MDAATKLINDRTADLTAKSLQVMEMESTIAASKLLAGGLVFLPALGAAIGLGLYFAAYNHAVARNPEARVYLDSKFWLILAFIEALGIIPIGLGAAIIFGG